MVAFVETQTARTRAPAKTGKAEAFARTANGLKMLKVDGPEFDAAVADFDEVAQEQLFAFSRARWPQVACEPLLFLRNETPVGAAMILIQPLPLRIGSIAVAKWGPMLARTDGPEAHALYKEIIEALVAEYADRRHMLLSVLPHASLEDENPAVSYLAGRGFSFGSVLKFPNRYLVNLRLDDSAQRKSLAQKWRYHLNKSEKEGLSFRRGELHELEAFDRLYQAMTERKRFDDHSAYATVEALVNDLPLGLKPELFFVEQGEELVAGAIIFTAGDRAVYLYGATNDRALPLRAGYFMHWHIIRWLRDNTRARWYDLGGTDGFQGLHQFKKGMVGDAGVITPVPPVMNFASSPLARLTGEGAFRARDAYYWLRHQILTRLPGNAKPTQNRDAA